MKTTDLLLDAVRREAEHRRAFTDGDPSITEITVTVKFRRVEGQRQAVALGWEAHSHRTLTTNGKIAATA